LFNRGGEAVDLTGWSVQYASATGASNFGSNVTAISGSIAPGQYFLVQEASGGAAGNALPNADASGAINLASGAGKVILADTTTGLACNGGSNPCGAAQLAQVVDLVGYGNANFFEGSAPAPSIDAARADFRASDGCADANDNAADFAAATPAPRNTSSPAHACADAPAQKEAWAVPPIQGGAPAPLFAYFNFGESACLQAEEFGLRFALPRREGFSEPRPRAGSKRSRTGASAYGPRDTRAGPPPQRGASP
jgi:hypothetical protein